MQTRKIHSWVTFLKGSFFSMYSFYFFSYSQFEITICCTTNMKINYLTTSTVTNKTHKLTKLFSSPKVKKENVFVAETFQRHISKGRLKITRKLLSLIKFAFNFSDHQTMVRFEYFRSCIWGRWKFADFSFLP